MGSYAVEKHSYYIVGPYSVPHIQYNGFAVYTNKPVASSMRGFSNINVTYAHEVQMDLMAEAIGMDPWEIRFINAWREGDTAPNQWKVVAPGLIETLKEAAKMEGIKLAPHLSAMSSQRRRK